MKKTTKLVRKISGVALLFWGSIGALHAQCLTASEGQYPFGTININCTGSPQNITPFGWAGEYSAISIVSGTTYTFTSSVASDFITIGNVGGTVALASGTTPLAWTSTVTGTVRFYTHTDAACGEEEVDRTRAISCAPPACPPATSVGVNSITMTTANVTWSGTGDFIVEYGPAGFTPGTGISAGAGGTVISSAASPQALSGLTGTTVYNVYVRNNCTSGSNGFSTNSAVASFTTLGQPPANDNCAAAVSLPINANCTPVSGSTLGATQSLNLPAPACGNAVSGWDDDVWYVMTTGSTQTAVNIDFTSVSGTIDLVAQIYSSGDGTCNSTFTPVACSDDDNGSLPEFINQAVLPNTTYFIRVFSYSSTPGTTANSNFTICVSIPPPAPSCVTNIAPANAAANVEIISGVNLSWTSDPLATEYEVYFSATGAPGDFSSSGTTTTNSYTVAGFNPATTYYWYVLPSNAGAQPAGGCELNATSFTTAPIPNDECPNAIDLSNQNTSWGSNSGSTQSMNGGACADGPDANDVWYKITAAISGNITITQGVSDFTDMVLEVLSGNCTTPVEVDCVDDAWNVAENSITFAANAGTTYYIRTYGWTGTETASFSIQATGNAPLPVNIDKLSAELTSGNHVLLSWNTLTELNNAGFHIQRSDDGKDFGNIGFAVSLANNGNSNTRLDYHFTDKEPVSETVYYRLQQLDKDGRTTLSNIVRLSVQQNGAVELLAVPNPVKNTVSINTYGVPGSNAYICITDVTGKQINRLPVKGAETLVDMSSLSQGIYFIKYTDDFQSQTIKVIKQ